jgi:Domain of unknown function (DUF5134)
VPPRPDWLYYLLGVLMLGVAAYGVALLGASVVWRRTAGRDVEVSHVAMGLAMAGMFVPSWSFGPDAAWVIVFLALVAWFVVRSLQSIDQFGVHLPHTAIHALMSATMLLMFWYPGTASRTSMSTAGMSMAMGSADAGGIDPALALVIAFVLFASAVFTVASPNKGATYYGTHHAGPAPVPALGEAGSPEGRAVPALVGVLATPSLLDASHVVMSAAMGLMLVLAI